MSDTAHRTVLAALRGQRQAVPPIWLMRQAGRYLPEYRATRAQAGGFMDLCFNPSLAAEVTLQPIRRYGFDASILFSDILIVPHGLGRPVAFKEGEGPVLDPLQPDQALALSLAFEEERFHQRVAPVYETVARLRQDLPKHVTLFGFAGSPWTVATYMIEGGSSRDFTTAKGWIFQHREAFGRVIDRLVEATIAYLSKQIEAGADALQLFDSWAGVLAEGDFEEWVIAPNRRIVEALRARYPQVPIIGFPRGAGVMYQRFVDQVRPDGISLDTSVPMGWAAETLQSRACLQGNLDPLALVAGGAAMERSVRRILAAAAGGPFIFNLGHGIVPQTPPDHVAQLVDLVRTLGKSLA